MGQQSTNWEGAVNDGSNYDADEEEFILAMERYRRVNHRPFPTCCEVLGVFLDLGYRKLAAPSTQPTYTTRPLGRVRTERYRLAQQNDD